MVAFNQSETLHRLVKQALDSGAVASVQEAEAMFRGYRLHVAIDPSEAAVPEDQAALLTCVALATRVFLGGVHVSGDLDVPRAVPLPFGTTLRDAVVHLGGDTALPDCDIPCVFIGGGPRPRRDSFQVRTVYNGWSGGVVPAHAEFATDSTMVMPLAPMLAAAFAISEAFFHVQGNMRVAGLRRVGLSLLRPGDAGWEHPEIDTPELRYLPSHLWLIGLGHLGQAYLWALGLLPYPKPSTLLLVLQDIDIITPSSLSTSILSDPKMLGMKKTRAMAGWAEQRGFLTALYERRFDATVRRHDDEPAIALCGLDNALGRRCLDQVGFSFVVEAGLGRGYRDFRTMRLHTLPGSRRADEIWKEASNDEDLTHRPAYARMLAEGTLDRCGVTLLAGRAVGAPFVGSVAACLAISEILRLLHGGALNQLIDLDLQSPDHPLTVAQGRAFDDFNPGYVDIRG